MVEIQLNSLLNHESRYSSNRAGDDPDITSEETPLLQRFPHPENSGRDRVTVAVVSLLVIVLVAGVFIGIYLLIIQSNSENILPPVPENPLELVSRSQWDSGGHPPLTLTPFTADRVVVVQTDTAPCSGVQPCSVLLRIMQANVTGEDKPLYNFMVSSDGRSFEGLGWHRPSPLYPQYPNSLVIAFIGNFSKVPPSPAQVRAAQELVAESVSRQRLTMPYSMFGKRTKTLPKHLFQRLETLPQWDHNLTDI